jgi:hypothetical protein
MSKAKIEKYKLFLQKTYWELNEGVELCCGCTEFAMNYSLDPELSKAFGLDNFNFLPSRMLEEQLSENKNLGTENISREYFERLYNLTLAAIVSGQMEAHAIKLSSLSLSEENWITYLVKPFDMIASAILNGFILPKELQRACKIFQAQKEAKILSEPLRKQIQREAIVLAFRYKYPEDSISEINRKIAKLKRHKDFSFLHGSSNRAREVVKSIQSASLTIPGVMMEIGNRVAFDFQRLDIFLNTIASLLFRSNAATRELDLLNHPLIRFYSEKGGKQMEKIVRYSLREHLKILNLGEVGAF